MMQPNFAVLNTEIGPGFLKKIRSPVRLEGENVPAGYVRETQPLGQAIIY